VGEHKALPHNPRPAAFTAPLLAHVERACELHKAGAGRPGRRFRRPTPLGERRFAALGWFPLPPRAT